jgi:hypothetical protein
MSAAAPPAPAVRFALLIEGLCRAVAARSAGGALGGALIILIWGRLRRMAARLSRLAARVHEFPPPAPASHRSGRSGPPPARLPKSFGWLVRLVPQAAASAAQLQHLLADPEFAALAAAAPQAGRILRPLCRMLGIRPPPGPLTPPPLTRRPRPRAPAPPRRAAPGPAPPVASHRAPPPPRPPTRAWLRRTGLPGRRRPILNPV